MILHINIFYAILILEIFNKINLSLIIAIQHQANYFGGHPIDKTFNLYTFSNCMADFDIFSFQC